jgi:hypothetical protein
MDRPMSRVGKEAFLKSLFQSISNYVMSLFQVPVGICDKMKTIIANHWWGFEDGRSKMHWHSWEWIIVQKSLGVWALEILFFFNQAILAKQCWHLVTHKGINTKAHDVCNPEICSGISP